MNEEVADTPATLMALMTLRATKAAAAGAGFDEGFGCLVICSLGGGDVGMASNIDKQDTIALLGRMISRLQEGQN